jgi:hypothetical protein
MTCKRLLWLSTRRRTICGGSGCAGIQKGMLFDVVIQKVRFTDRIDDQKVTLFETLVKK